MGAEPVVVLYASISVLNWMRAATGSQCKQKRNNMEFKHKRIYINIGMEKNEVKIKNENKKE